MTSCRLSVVIPTHNRPEKLAQLIGCLVDQDLDPAAYEVVVVDDRSTPPATLPARQGGPVLRLIRLEGGERSVGRNTGASHARGDLLVFLDDDMLVERDFLSRHLGAHARWPDALVVGSIRLPAEVLKNPFGRFRQALEDACLPEGGPTSMRNFCAAGNMSISRAMFDRIGGFDRGIVSSEDQDLAMRHTALGGRIVFASDVRAVHCDNALDIRTYAKRLEWGNAKLMPFCARYPDFPDNVERLRVNGPVRLGRESVSLSYKKVIKSLLAVPVAREALFGLTAVLERAAAPSAILERMYRLLIGVHLFEGYRAGLAESDNGPRAPAILAPPRGSG